VSYNILAIHGCRSCTVLHHAHINYEKSDGLPELRRRDLPRFFRTPSSPSPVPTTASLHARRPCGMRALWRRLRMHFFRPSRRGSGKKGPRMDRPKGTAHPRFPDLLHPIDCGFIPGTRSRDGVDAFRGDGQGHHVVGIIGTPDRGRCDSGIRVLADCSGEDLRTALQLLTREPRRTILVRRPARSMGGNSKGEPGRTEAADRRSFAVFGARRAQLAARAPGGERPRDGAAPLLQRQRTEADGPNPGTGSSHSPKTSRSGYPPGPTSSPAGMARSIGGGSGPPEAGPKVGGQS